MAIPHGGYVQFEYIGFLFGQTTINTFTYQWLHTTLVADLEWTAAESAIDDALRDNFLACLSEEWEGVATRVYNPSPASTEAAFLFPMTEDGLVAEGSEPPAVAGVITKRTSLKGPRGRGRVFLPAVPISFHENGRLTSTGVGLYNDLGDSMQAPVPILDPEGNLVPVVYSRVALNGAAIVDCSAQPILRSQRRRQIGVGI